MTSFGTWTHVPKCSAKLLPPGADKMTLLKNDSLCGLEDNCRSGGTTVDFANVILTQGSV